MPTPNDTKWHQPPKSVNHYLASWHYAVLVNSKQWHSAIPQRTTLLLKHPFQKSRQSTLTGYENIKKKYEQFTYVRILLYVFSHSCISFCRKWFLNYLERVPTGANLRLVFSRLLFDLWRASCRWNYYIRRRSELGMQGNSTRVFHSKQMQTRALSLYGRAVILEHPKFY